MAISILTHDGQHQLRQDAVELRGIDLMRLPNLWNDLVALRSLEDLDLGVYRIGREYRIGLRDPAAHPHDRWLFQATSGENWVLMPRQDGHGPLQSEPVLLRDLGSELRGIQSTPKLLAPTIKPSETLRLWLLLGSRPLDPKLIRKYVQFVPGNLPNFTLHEMIYHYPRWSARQAEFAGMPQDLVLRAHGLGPLLDAGYPLV